MRWFYFFICAVLGLALLACGLLVPVHLRAIDASVIATAGKNTPGVLDEGQALADKQRLGAAELLLQAARTSRIMGWENLDSNINTLAQKNPASMFWGDDSRMKNLFGRESSSLSPNSPFTSFVVQEANRQAMLDHLQTSPSPTVTELLKTRSIQKTVLFPPSSSPSGQAFDTAVCVCGLLLDDNALTSRLSWQLSDVAAQANHGHSSLPVEQALMDFMSLGQRFNWDQLRAFVAAIPNTTVLNQLTDQVRTADTNLPVLFAAMELTGNATNVANYLAGFPKSGMDDFRVALRHGAGGISKLVMSDKRYYTPAWEANLPIYSPLAGFVSNAAAMCLQKPWEGFVLKWLLYLLAGFALTEAAYFARPLERASPLDKFFLSATLRPSAQTRRQSRQFHFIAVSLVSLAFLFVVLLLSEPFLAQEAQKGHFSLRLFPSMVGGKVAAGIAGFKQTAMNPTVIFTMCVFFVLQALIFYSCITKLNEIRRHKVAPRIRLRLLENEDHLFDAGLYLGFVGTIVSLIIASMGLVKFSLMAAYSSTSFGIVFVVIFKIFYLRPARRTLLMEAEMQAAGHRPPPGKQPPTAAPKPTTPPPAAQAPAVTPAPATA